MANKIISIEDRIPKLKEQRKKKANRRIFTLLFLFFLLAISVLYFQSPYSKIGEIHVTGNKLVSQEEIITASQLTDKTVLFNLNKNEIAERILTLPAIKNVEISIGFPNKVAIAVKEQQILGYLQENGTINPFLEDGIVVETNGMIHSDVGPILQNFTDVNTRDLLAKALEEMPEEIRHSISEIIYTPKETDEYSIRVYMNDGNEVRATLRTFADKMKYYPTFVKQLNPDEKGIIDIEVGAFFKSYQAEINDSNTENNEKQNQEDSAESQ